MKAVFSRRPASPAEKFVFTGRDGQKITIPGIQKEELQSVFLTEKADGDWNLTFAFLDGIPTKIERKWMRFSYRLEVGR